MTYPFTATEEATLTSLLSSAQSSNDYTSIYKFILYHISEFSITVSGYNQVTHSIMEYYATPASGVDPSVWLWARGAYGVNDSDENNFFSDFIRDYTEVQYSLRYGATIGDVDMNDIHDLQDASNEIADNFAQSILDSGSGTLPSLRAVGEIDAGEAASKIFKQRSVDGDGNYAPWAGTILFPFLGQGYNPSDPTDVSSSFLSQWILQTGTNNHKKLSGTYDLISIAQVSHEITNLWESWANGANLVETVQNNRIGKAATLNFLSYLREEANGFFQDVYDLPDIGLFQIGGDLPLYGEPYDYQGLDYAVHPNFIIGSLDDDASIQTFDTAQQIGWYNTDIVHAGLGNDLILGSLGQDLIDGGEGNDHLSYFNVTSDMWFIYEQHNGTLVDAGGATIDGRWRVGLTTDPYSDYQYVYDVEKIGGTLSDDTFHLRAAEEFEFYGNIGFDFADFGFLDADYTSLLVDRTDITVVDREYGEYEIEITYQDGSVELSTLDGIERIAHGEVSVNTHDANVQGNTAIASHGDGYVVVWESRSQFSTNKYAIMGQRYDSSGNELGSEFQVSPGNNRRSEEKARVTETADGGFAVVWLAKNSPNKTFMAIYDSNGNRTSTDIDVFANDPDDRTKDTNETYQDVATLSNGNMIVVAQASGNFVDSTDIIGQIIAPDGSHIGTKFICCTTQAGMQTDPMVTALSNGGFVVTWTEADGSSNGITAQIFDAQGGIVGGTIQVNTTTYGNQQDSAITTTTDGGFVVTWNAGSSQDGSGTGIYFKKYDASGAEIIGETLVNDKTSGNQAQAKVKALEDGGFIITFTDHTSSGGDIWAQQYDANADRVQDNFLVNVTTSLTQTEADVTGLGNGDFAFAWETTTSSSSTETLARLYSNSAPIPLPPPTQMMVDGGSGSSTLIASQSLQSSSQAEVQPETVETAKYVADLYEERDPVFQANGETEGLTYHLADYTGPQSELIDGLSFEDVFEVSDAVMRAVSDNFDLVETADNRDIARSKENFQTVTNLNDTTGIDIADMIGEDIIEIV